jgi:hypothetical protein
MVTITSRVVASQLELVSVQKILMKDISILEKYVLPKPQQSGEPQSEDFIERHHAIGRFLVKTVITYIDAICHQLRLVSASVEEDQLSQLLCPEEFSALSYEEIKIGDKGVVRKQPMRVSFYANLEFSIKCYSKVFSCEFDLDKSNDGWANLKNTVRARDRIVHPRSSDGLILSSTELNETANALKWFNEEVSRLFSLRNLER